MEDNVAGHWRRLIRPRQLETVKAGDRYGRFLVRPLEKGFGMIVGNSLRRVLLSSLQGAAVTSVKIEGVQHEFSALPGVVEDVTDMVLNFKSVRVRTHHDVVHGVLDVQGSPGVTTVVRAGDLRFDRDAEVLNPDHVVATVTQGIRFFAEATIELGRGYEPGAMKNVANLPIGTIPVDALHSPVEKVRYNVLPARVGDRTDLEQLEMELWTDGSLSPADALAYAAKVIKEQLLIFASFSEDHMPSDDGRRAKEPPPNPYLNKRVDELELSVRSANCLQNAGIEFIWQLVQRSEAEMLKTKNFGRKSLNEIKEILSELDLSLGMRLPDFQRAGSPN
jgi:DNA-directed RNA polymerase subunit alpha